MGKFGRLFESIRTFRNWPAHYLDRYGLGLWKIEQLKLRNGLHFNVRPRTADLRTSKSVLVENLYWEAGLELAPDATVVDIGAHIGFFTVQAAARVPRGRVFAFEPEPENFRYLEKNVRANGLRNVELTRGAVAGREGWRKLYLQPGRDTGGHSLFVPRAESVNVSCTTLRRIVERAGHVDFLKLDCEGAENEILMGAEDGVLSYVGAIAMEQHDVSGGQRDAVVRRLRKTGYEVTFGRRRGYVFANRIR